MQECQLNRADPREVKDNSKNFLKTNGKSTKHSYLPAAAKRRTVTKRTANIQADCRYTERGALSREGLSNICLISVESVLDIVKKICWSEEFSCDAQFSSSC